MQDDGFRAAQAALAAARQQYEDLFELVPDACLLTNLDGRIRAANQATSALIGYSRRYALGKPLSAFVAPEGAQSFATRLRSLREAPPEHVTEFALVLRSPRTGPVRDVQARVRRIEQRGGEPCLLWVLRDVSKQQRLERELHSLLATQEEIIRTRTAELEAIVRMQQTAQVLDAAALTALRARIRQIAEEAVTLLQQGGAPADVLIQLTQVLLAASGDDSSTG